MKTRERAEQKRQVRRDLTKAGCKNIEMFVNDDNHLVVECTPLEHNTLQRVVNVNYPTTVKEFGITYIIFNI